MKLGTKICIGTGVAVGVCFAIVKGVQKIAEDLDDMVKEFDEEEDEFDFDKEIAKEFDKENEMSEEKEAAVMAEEEKINSSENFTESTDCCK